MASLEYFLVAESVSVDQTTNRASVFNIFEELRSAGDFPVVVPQLTAICAWNMDDGEAGQDFQALIRIAPPGDREAREMRVNFVGNQRRSRLIFNVVGLPLEAEGDLRFEIELDGVHQASHTVTVLRGEVPAPSGDATARGGAVDPPASG